MSPVFVNPNQKHNRWIHIKCIFFKIIHVIVSLDIYYYTRKRYTSRLNERTEPTSFRSLYTQLHSPSSSIPLRLHVYVYKTIILTTYVLYVIHVLYLCKCWIVVVPYYTSELTTPILFTSVQACLAIVENILANRFGLSKVWLCFFALDG